MSGVWIDSINRFADAWLEAAVRTAWQGALLAGAIWLVCKMWRRMPPSLSAYLWLVLGLKLVVGLIPFAVSIPLLPPEKALPTVPMPSVSGQEASFIPVNEIALVVPSLSLNAFLLLGWIAGALGLLISITFALVRLRRIHRASEPVSDQDLLAAVRELADRMHLRRVPAVRIANSSIGVFTFGTFRPTILIAPSVLERCSPDELRLVLAHEMAHITRGDTWLSLIPQASTLLFYFHPAAWLAAREFELAREVACDEIAVRTLDARSDAYGRLLVKLSSRQSFAGSYFVLGISSHFRALSRRIAMLKNVSNDKPLRTHGWVRAAFGLTLAAVILPWAVVHAQTPSPLEPKLDAPITLPDESRNPDKSSVSSEPITDPVKPHVKSKKPTGETTVYRAANVPATELSETIAINLGDPTLRVIVDKDANSLILMGSDKAVRKLITRIKQLDVRSKNLIGSTDAQQPVLVAVQHKDASTLARQVSGEFEAQYKESELQILVEVRTNTILVKASKTITQKIVVRLSELDRAPSPDQLPEAKKITMFRIKNVDATALAIRLAQSLGEDRGKNTVFSDTATNSIIVQAGPTLTETVAAQISILDRSPGSNPRSKGQMVVRRFKAPNVSAEMAVQWVAQELSTLSIDYLTYDPLDNTVIVRAESKDMDQIGKFIADLNTK